MSYKPSGDLIESDGRTSQSVVSGFTNTFTVHAEFHDIAADTAFMLIDLSDTTNWPHTDTDHIVIEYLILQVDPNSSFVGEIKLGFLSSVDATDGDFNQILEIDLRKQSALVVEVINFGSHGLHLEASRHFGLVSADNVLFQTDTNLEGPDGQTSYPSGDGDLVLFVDQTTSDVNVSITLGYETIPA